MSNDLLLLRESTIEQAFITGDGVDTAINELSDIVRGYEHNLSTISGRKKTASLAAKVSKVKTAVDAIGKDMVSDWKSQAKIVDANRKKMRDACDSLRDEARKPLTDWENEQARIEEEERAAIEAEKAAALLLADHEIGLLLNEKRDDDLAAQLILEAQAEEERKRVEREQLEKAATERAERLLIEQQAQLERDQLAAKELANKAERDVKLAEERHIEQKRQSAIAAEQAAIKATEDAKAAAEAARQQAIKEQQDKEEAEQAAKAKAEANTRHVSKIRKQAKESLMAEGLTEEQAKKIVLAINGGKIKNVAINYYQG